MVSHVLKIQRLLNRWLLSPEAQVQTSKNQEVISGVTPRSSQVTIFSALHLLVRACRCIIGKIEGTPPQATCFQIWVILPTCSDFRWIKCNEKKWSSLFMRLPHPPELSFPQVVSSSPVVVRWPYHFRVLSSQSSCSILGSLYNRYGPSSPHFLTFTNQIGYVFQDDAWVVINGEAIDVTKWISIHPGGEQAIMAYLGKDRAAAVAIFLFWLLQIGLEELNWLNLMWRINEGYQDTVLNPKAYSNWLWLWSYWSRKLGSKQASLHSIFLEIAALGDMKRTLDQCRNGLRWNDLYTLKS